jgi:hypothetical protein
MTARPAATAAALVIEKLRNFIKAGLSILSGIFPEWKGYLFKAFTISLLTIF